MFICLYVLKALGIEGMEIEKRFINRLCLCCRFCLSVTLGNEGDFSPQCITDTACHTDSIRDWSLGEPSMGE